MSAVLNGALQLAAAGLHVFPVRVRIVDGTKDVTPISHWPEKSTTDPDTIRGWWESEQWANASVAYDTGKSQLAVVDCDGELGMANWRHLARETGAPETWRARTPGGGEHWIYRADPLKPIRNTVSEIGTCVDTRGVGGFIIAPPSRDDRGAYQWVEGEPEWSQLPTVPSYVTANAPHRSTKPDPATDPANAFLMGEDRTFTDEQAWAFVQPALEKLRTAPDKTINKSLNNAAITVGHFLDGGFWTREQATGWLMDALRHTVYDGQTWQADPTIRSGLDAAARDWQAKRSTTTFDPPAADAGTADSTVGPAGFRLITGGSFIYDAPEKVPSLWGDGDEVLWAAGEPLMITGPTGAGKTTLCTQVVAGRLGLVDQVLGYPVTPGRRVLYLAMDRPAQIARAMGRLFRQFPREVLDDRLIVWTGPPPQDLARNPKMLLTLAQLAKADTVVIDSIKDAAVKISDEETGQGLNTAQQLCVANGVEVLDLHHQRKQTNGAGGGKPTSISDVYGSAWLTAGQGSVVLIWGAAGDLIVELSHLKQPADKVGPFKVRHDHVAGRSYRTDSVDLLDLIAVPATVREVAMKLSDGDSAVSRTEIEAVRRKLKAAVRRGVAKEIPGPAGGSDSYVRTGSWGVTEGVTGDPDHTWSRVS